MRAEEALGCRFDAVHAGAEIDMVQIEGEDFVLGVPVLEIEREHRFFDLALKRALRFQEQVLGELLGDGRTALHIGALADVGEHRADDAPGINAEMRTEAVGPRWR